MASKSIHFSINVSKQSNVIREHFLLFFFWRSPLSKPPNINFVLNIVPYNSSPPPPPPFNRGACVVSVSICVAFTKSYLVSLFVPEMDEKEIRTATEILSNARVFFAISIANISYLEQCESNRWRSHFLQPFWLNVNSSTVCGMCVCCLGAEHVFRGTSKRAVKFRNHRNNNTLKSVMVSYFFFGCRRRFAARYRYCHCRHCRPRCNVFSCLPNAGGFIDWIEQMCVRAVCSAYPNSRLF